MSQAIPSAAWWHPIRDGLKAVIRAVGGPRLVSWAGTKYAWGLTLLNYGLMRVPFLGRALKIGAWPHALYIEGTNICNAKCVFCAYPEMQRPKKVMSMDFFRSVIDQYVAMGGTEVDLTPIVGDPFVDGQILERLDYLESKPQLRRFHFFTNAIGMRPELSRPLLRYGSRLRVYISFGGFDRETYHKVFGVDKFEVVVPHIKALIEAKREARSELGLQVNLRTPKANNQGELFDYLVKAKGEGVIELTWMGAYDSWAGHIKDHELTEAGLVPRGAPVKRGACHRLLTSPVVLADGRVNACACRDVEASLIIGDLNQRTLAEVLSGPELYKLVEQHAKGELPDVCRRCTYYDSILPSWLAGEAPRPDPAGVVGTEY